MQGTFDFTEDKGGSSVRGTLAFARRGEIGVLIKKLYESFATGMIPENHFSETAKRLRRRTADA
jgi:hypothetical protein